MSDELKEFADDMKALRDDLTRYYDGDFRYPWNVIRLDLSNIDDDIPMVLSAVEKITAENSRLREIMARTIQPGCRCQACVDMAKVLKMEPSP